MYLVVIFNYANSGAIHSFENVVQAPLPSTCFTLVPLQHRCSHLCCRDCIPVGVWAVALTCHSRRHRDTTCSLRPLTQTQVSVLTQMHAVACTYTYRTYTPLPFKYLPLLFLFSLHVWSALQSELVIDNVACRLYNLKKTSILFK